jgi:hypothetical protein
VLTSHQPAPVASICISLALLVIVTHVHAISVLNSKFTPVFCLKIVQVQVHTLLAVFVSQLAFHTNGFQTVQSHVIVVQSTETVDK